VAAGTAVVTTGIVTGVVAGDGFYMQDPTGPLWAGIYVFVNGTVSVVAGDAVRVQGTIVEFYTVTQLENPTVTKTGTGSITPLSITFGQVNDNSESSGSEAYEGMLVQLTGDATCTNVNPDAGSGDFGEMLLTDSTGQSLRVGNDVWSGYARTLNHVYTTVRGIATYTFYNRKLLPRSAADLAP
jgi:predicted extracellular nuclease